VADEKKNTEFRVIDRRLFTADGEMRKEVIEEGLRDDVAAPSTPAANPAAPPAAAANAGRAPAPDMPAQPAAEAPRPSRSFQLLVDFIARNSAALLGGYADPRTGQAMLDLEGAQELIDMLDALREKTRGNLAPEEDRFLLEITGSLKLQFLEMSKAAAKAMREQAARKS
jgi:hypothetical protein